MIVGWDVSLLSDIRCKNDSRNDESIVDQASSYRGLDPSDERGVTCMYPRSDFDCDRCALNVNVDVVGEKPRHPEPDLAGVREVARNPRDRESESNDSSLDVESDLRSSVEQIHIDDGIIT